jgi:hypothetical protein
MVAKAPAVNPVGQRLRQRKCACASHGIDGKCEECRKNALASQRRATVAEPARVPPIVQEVLRSHGQPLDPATRAFFERRLGHDFSHVRVHADMRAAASARAVIARAYTVGSDLVFGYDQYAPSTARGRRLLEHELTHVMEGAPGIARDNDPTEHPELETILAPELETGSGKASAIQPRLRPHIPAGPATTEWRTRVVAAIGQPQRDREKAYLELINEAILPDAARFPELRLPVTLFKSEAAARHGEVSLDTSGGEFPESGKTQQLRAETLPSDEKLGTPPRIFIRMTPAALHPAEGPVFTQRVLAHEFVHFLSKLKRKAFPPQECDPEGYKSQFGNANPNKEVEIVSTTFSRFFPTWATADKLYQIKNLSQVPVYIKEDLALLQNFFPCAAQEFRIDAIIRIATSVEDNPIRKRLLLRLVELIRNAMAPSIGTRNNAMERLAAALGDQPIPRNPRIPQWTREEL